MVQKLTLEQWARLHNDATHPGTRDTCEHCQLMIQSYGPMPPIEDLRRALGIIEAQGNKYTKRAIPDSIRWEVWERDNFTCRVCGARRYLTIDHIVPESLGGGLDLDNLQTLCNSCNSRKGTRSE